jgi:ADP-ribosylglycohydrolase
MPVHWFYNPGDILRQFPPHGIKGMQAAPALHPSSIMRLHSTSRGGRGLQSSEAQVDIVGDVILKGKRHLWGRPNGHYHHGMQAGENTLNAWWARWVMQSMTRNGSYDPNRWVAEYIEKMTADPPQHPDTYAESCHRGFFANLQSGMPPTRCGAVTHDTPSMGALVTVAPLALALLATQPLDLVQQQCRTHVWLTHPDNTLMKVVDSYVALMASLLERSEGVSCLDPLATAAAVIPGTRLESLIDQPRGDAYVVGRMYSLACYISDSWPSVCYLAARYHDDPGKALLTNTNLGGENAHRGSVLGTLVGLASGLVDEDLYSCLAGQNELDRQLNQWLDRFYG